MALSCRACPLRHCFAMTPLPEGEALLTGRLRQLPLSSFSQTGGKIVLRGGGGLEVILLLQNSGHPGGEEGRQGGAETDAPDAQRQQGDQDADRPSARTSTRTMERGRSLTRAVKGFGQTPARSGWRCRRRCTGPRRGCGAGLPTVPSGRSLRRNLPQARVSDGGVGRRQLGKLGVVAAARGGCRRSRRRGRSAGWHRSWTAWTISSAWLQYGSDWANPVVTVRAAVHAGNAGCPPGSRPAPAPCAMTGRKVPVLRRCGCTPGIGDDRGGEYPVGIAGAGGA